MTYTVNRYDATLLVNLADLTLDTSSTSLTLIGQDYVGFGEQINENYVHLLENFRGTSAPSNPLEGQIWYDNNTNILKVYNGASWNTIDQDTIYGKNAMSSGVKTGGELSIDVDTTKFDISAGTGYVIDNSTDPSATSPTLVSWSAFNAQTVTNIATQPVTYISISSAGAIVQASTFPDAEDRRLNIFLGVVVHSDNTIVNVVNNLPVVAYDVGGQVQDLMNSFGFRSEKGNLISANGVNLSFDKASGIGFKAGANFHINPNNPHQIIMAALTAATFRYRNQDSSEGSDVTVIDPTTYDNAGTTTTVPANNNATIQRVYIFPSNIIRVQRGQEVFATLGDAIDSVGREDFIVEDNISENGLLLGSIVTKKTATDLTDSAEAKVIPASTAISGAIGFTTTLQQSYDVSPTPEIVTNSTSGALSVQRGSAADTDNVLEIANGATTVVFAVTGEGNVTLSGTVDGRDIATDGTKLDGIEALADVTDVTNVTAAGALMLTGGTLSGNLLTSHDGPTPIQMTRTIGGNSNIKYSSPVGTLYAGLGTASGRMMIGSTDNLQASGQRVFADDYHPNADTWTTGRTIELTGDVTGTSAAWDGSANISFATTLDSDVILTNRGAVVTDFDNYTSNGIYKVDNWVVVGILNGPTGSYPYGMLKVTQFLDANYVLQEYWPHNTDIVWSRIRWGGAWPSWREAWGSGNDGVGSGLDADTLDTFTSADFVRRTAVQTITAVHTYQHTSGDTTIDVKSNATSTNAYIDFLDDTGVRVGYVGHINSSLRLNGTWRFDTVPNVAGDDIFHDGYHPNADTWTTGRTIELTGDVTGTSAAWDGSGNISFATVVANDSHTHSTYLPLTGGTLSGDLTMNAAIQMNDGELLKFGSDTDARFSHNGADMITNLNTGNWKIRDDVNDRFLFERTTGNFTALGTIDAPQLKTDEVRALTATQLVLNAGESNTYATGQTVELVYINAEGGVQINSSPDNWATGWASRYTATICDVSGNSTLPGDLDVGAALTAVTKSFLITHPLDASRKLRYGSLEGPENGVYIRGRLTDDNKIQLPDYWAKLIDETTITVTLTGINSTVFVKDVNIHEVTVKQNWLNKIFGKKIDCYYTIYAERNDVDKLVVEV